VTPATRNRTTIVGRQKVGRFVLLIYGQIAVAVASFLALPSLVFYPRVSGWTPWRVLLVWVLSCAFMFFVSRVSGGSAGWRRYFARVPWIAAASAGLGVLCVVAEAYWRRQPHIITDYEGEWLIASVFLFALAGFLLYRGWRKIPVQG
jgi:hypothetical protein